MVTSQKSAKAAREFLKHGTGEWTTSKVACEFAERRGTVFAGKWKPSLALVPKCALASWQNQNDRVTDRDSFLSPEPSQTSLTSLTDVHR